MSSTASALRAPKPRATRRFSRSALRMLWNCPGLFCGDGGGLEGIESVQGHRSKSTAHPLVENNESYFSNLAFSFPTTPLHPTPYCLHANPPIASKSRSGADKPPPVIYSLHAIPPPLSPSSPHHSQDLTVNILSYLDNPDPNPSTKANLNLSPRPQCPFFAFGGGKGMMSDKVLVGGGIFFVGNLLSTC